MRKFNDKTLIESLESRRLLSTTWALYAKLVDQNVAASDFPTINGKGVAVAVIDTGIDYTQPELGGGFGPGFKVEAGYDFYSNDSNPMDESGHGTSVASVIAATPYKVNGITYQGVAPDAKLIALRVGTETDIPDANIQAALEWILNNNHYKTYNIRVINLSLGSGNYTAPEVEGAISDDFAKLKSLGIFVVAASGNSQDQENGPITQDGIAFPAADPNVFAAGAVDSNDVIADFTQRGSELDLLAPGVQIVMAKLGGGFTTEDGTSFSSPYTAGTAALIEQEDPTVEPGDVGSILMSSGKDNRDGDTESGNTTGLEFSRLDISSALALTKEREANSSTLDMGRDFSTALDSDGVLHAAFYDDGELLYATRDISGMWSKTQIIDNSGDVGSQLSVAVDTTGKVGIGYFDDTNTAAKFAMFNGTAWSDTTVESAKNVGTSPSVGFTIYGDVYLSYYRRSGGVLRLAHLFRDTGKWERQTVDGGNGVNVGVDNSLDIGEAPVSNGFFTHYDATVAIAYSDSTNGDLKYARLDVEDPTATWYVSLVENDTGVDHIALNLHAGPEQLGLQAQIAYQDTSTADVKYAFRDQDWFVEDVATTGKLGDDVQIYFDSDDNPIVVYYDRVKRALYTASRDSSNDGSTGTWSSHRTASSSGPMSVSLNERTGKATLTYLNRPKTAISTSEVI